MIVLDEQLMDAQLAGAIRAWWPGRVCRITDLGPGRFIEDEAIPSLLCRTRRPTLITINGNDFWLRARAEPAFCIACFELPRERRGEIPSLLRRLLALDGFSTRASRMGKVVTVSHSRIRYYEFPPQVVHAIPWPKA